MTMPEALVTAAIYCTCGAGWRGTMPTSAWCDVIARWGEVHVGENHEPCDAKTTAKARKRRDQEAIWERSR